MNRLSHALAMLLMAGVNLALAEDQPSKLLDAVAPRGTITASIDLAAEFPQIAQLKGYIFTQTLTTVAPGTGRPLHSHANNPEIVRILSGTLTDARNGEAPKSYGPGSTLINAAGTEHMWANLGSEPVVFIATAIRAPQ